MICSPLCRAFVLCFSSLPLFGWGVTGHRIIAALAEQRLAQEDPQAAAAVRALLGGRSLADISTWADEVRHDRPQTFNWHFVNIPLSADAYVASRDCAPTERGDCAVAEIIRAYELLKKSDAAPLEREEALKFLVHMISDLHQPLHGGYAFDKGGNDIKVTFLGEELAPPYREGEQRYPWNLHSVWDDGLIKQTGRDEAGYVAYLRPVLPKTPKVDLQKDAVAWAEESHAQVKQAYDIGEKRMVDEAYCRRSIVLVDQRLREAAVRLASVLQELFKSGS